MRESDISGRVMVRERPVRSLVTVVVPLLFAAGQLTNSYYHGVSLVYSGAVAVLFVGIAVLTLQRQYAAFRASRLGLARTDEG